MSSPAEVNLVDVADISLGNQNCEEFYSQSDAIEQRSTEGSTATLKSKVKALFQWMFKEILAKELITLLKITVPISLTLVFQVGLLWVSLLYVGHLPDRKRDQSYLYDAAGLGNSFVNVTGVAIGNGVATAADTLCSQAFGYKNYRRVGIILQRGILIIGLFVFPIWALWLNVESMLLLIAQEPCVARYSSIYTRLFMIAIPFIFLQIMLQHYLQSQSIVWQFVMIGFISNIVSAILHAIVIFGAKLGFLGAVISLVISNTLPPLLVIAYVWFRGLHKQTWSGWSYESLQEWGLFLKLALPGLLMMVIEWWSFELITFLAGIMGDNQLAASIVWYQILVLIYVPSFGISIATSIRVGNELGAGNPNKAKRAAFTAVACTFCLCVVIVVVILSTKNVIAGLFVSGNNEVEKIVSTLMYLAAIFIFTDQTQIVIGGVLRGSGRQYIGAIMIFVSYFVIGLPIGVVLGFKANLKLFGIWIGMTIGNIILCAVFVIILWRTNWKKLSEKAIKRASDRGSSEYEHHSLSNDESETPLEVIGNKSQEQEQDPHSQEQDSQEQEQDSHSQEQDSHSQEQDSHSQEQDPHSQEQDSHSQEQDSHSQEQDSHSQEQDPNSQEQDTHSLSSTDSTEDHNIVDTATLLSEEELVNSSRNTIHSTHKGLRRIPKILLHASFYVIGIVIVAAGGVGSRYKPYVDPELYTNCSYGNLSLMNDSDSWT